MKIMEINFAFTINDHVVFCVDNFLVQFLAEM